MAIELPVVAGARVLVVRGDLADQELAKALRARGGEVDDVVGYRTREAPVSSRPLLRRALADGPIDAVVFTSGSTVRGLVALARAESLDIAAIPSVCIGPETAAEARRAGKERRPAVNACTRCGTRNEPDAKFCKQCGDRLGSANA